MPDNRSYPMPSHTAIIKGIKNNPVFQRNIQEKGLDMDEYYKEKLQRGVCSGITALFLQQASMYGVEKGVESMNNLLSDKSLFQQLIDFLIQYFLGNDKSYQPKFSGSDIIGSYQSSENNEQDQYSLTDKLMSMTFQAVEENTQKFQIAHTELASAINCIPEKTMCRLSAFKFHATGIYKESGELYFYDSNRAAAVAMTADDIAEHMIMKYGKDCGNEFHLMLMSKAPIPTESVEKLQSAQITRFNQLDTSNLSDLGVSKKRLAYRGVIHQLPGDTLAECITRLITQSLGPKNDSTSKLDPVTLLGILVDAMLNKSKTSHSPFPKAAEESATNAAIAFVSYATRAGADPQDTQSMFSALSENIEIAVSLGKENFESVLFDVRSSGYQLKSAEEQNDILSVFSALKELEPNDNQAINSDLIADNMTCPHAPEPKSNTSSPEPDSPKNSEKP